MYLQAIDKCKRQLKLLGRIEVIAAVVVFLITGLLIVGYCITPYSYDKSIYLVGIFGSAALGILVDFFLRSIKALLSDRVEDIETAIEYRKRSRESWPPTQEEEK